jgi:hypothetical protein
MHSRGWNGRLLGLAVVAVVLASACGRSSEGSPPGLPQSPAANPTARDASGAAAPVGVPPPVQVSSGDPAGSIQVGSPRVPDVTMDTARAGPMAARTRAVELKVESVQRVPQLGDRHARDGYEFVIVDTSWTNIIPLTPAPPKGNAQNDVGRLGGLGGNRQAAPDPATVEMISTPFVVPMLRRQIWLLSDGRFADTVDLDAQVLAPNHLDTEGFGIPNLGDIVRGTLVFEAPVGVHSQALQFYDTEHGHALVPLSGEAAPAVPAPVGPTRQNELLQLAVTEGRFLPNSADTPAGQRPYLIGLRGTSRSAKDLIVVPKAFIWAQTDQGCLASPVPDREGLSRPFGDEATFVPTGPNEGQVVFDVPTETRAVRLLVRAQRGGALDVPAGAEFQPSWPAPVATIADGGVGIVRVLPKIAPPATLPTAGAQRRLALDLVFENKSQASGIELQWIQLRIETADGGFVDPSPLSAQVPCNLADNGTIPPGTARRFTLVYELPDGVTPARLQYRGFEVQETAVDLP